MSDQPRVRNLVIVLGDQLDADSVAFDGFDPDCDAVLQMEVMEEATYVRQHKKRIAFFFSAMRHFRMELDARRRRVHYVDLRDKRGKPVAGTWNFDSENERAFGRKDPAIPEREGVALDQITQQVLKMAESGLIEQKKGSIQYRSKTNPGGVGNEQ